MNSNSSTQVGSVDPWSNRVCPNCTVRGLTFCGGFDASTLDRLHTSVTHINLSPGQTLTSEGMPADHVYNIAAGTMKLYKLMADGRRQIVAFLAEGDFVGVSRSSLYTYSVDALTKVHLCRLPRRKLEILMDEFPEARRRFYTIMVDDLAAAQDHMLLLGRKTAEEKVCSFFVQLSQKATARGRPATDLALPMKRSDMADFLGLTIETVSRTLTILRKRNLIVTPTGSRVGILDFDTVAMIAEGGGS